MDDPAAAAAPAAPGTTPIEASLAELSSRAFDYARALMELVVTEAAVARINFVRLLIGALLVPALALGLFVCADALLADILFELSGRWLFALACVMLCNVVALLVLLWMLRSWWRSLSLPRSRAAITALWTRHDDTQAKGAQPPALGTG
jgi:hypothetical protein